MIFQAVGERCAVDLHDSGFWPHRPQDVMAHLRRLGFIRLRDSIASVAGRLIGQASWRRGALLQEAPGVFDCAGFTKWVYGQMGIWLPRRSIQQCRMGESVRPESHRPGDLIFTRGARPYYSLDGMTDLGHAAIIVDDRHVIHAVNKKLGVKMSLLRTILASENFRVIRRIIPTDAKVVSYRVPAHWEVETSDDIRWIFLGTLGP